MRSHSKKKASKSFNDYFDSAQLNMDLMKVQSNKLLSRKKRGLTLQERIVADKIYQLGQYSSDNIYKKIYSKDLWHIAQKLLKRTEKGRQLNIRKNQSDNKEGINPFTMYKIQEPVKLKFFNKPEEILSHYHSRIYNVQGSTRFKSEIETRRIQNSQKIIKRNTKQLKQQKMQLSMIANPFFKASHYKSMQSLNKLKMQAQKPKFKLKTRQKLSRAFLKL